MKTQNQKFSRLCKRCHWRYTSEGYTKINRNCSEKVALTEQKYESQSPRKILQRSFLIIRFLHNNEMRLDIYSKTTFSFISFYKLFAFIE